MAIYKEDIANIELTTGNIHRTFMNRAIGTGDNKADRFGVRVFRDGVAVNLSGVTVQGVFLPPQGEPIAITGSSYTFISGNVAMVTLPQACYNYEGMFTLAIKLVSAGEGITGTMRIVDGMVNNTHSSGTVAPTESVPTYQEILSVYDEMVEFMETSENRFDAVEAATNNYIIKSDKLEQGQYTGGGGKEDNSKRIRLIDPIHVPKGTVFTFDIGDLYWLMWELSSADTTGGNVITATEWNRDASYTVQNDCWIMMAIANGETVESSTTITPSSFDGYYVAMDQIGSGVPGEIADLSVFNKIKSGISQILIMMEQMERGQFTGSYGKQDSSIRIRLINPIRVPKGTRFTFETGGLYWLLWELSSSRTTGGNVITSTGWNQNTSYTVQNDCWIMLSFATANTVETSDVIKPEDFRPYYVAISSIGNGITEEIASLKQVAGLQRLPELYTGEFKQAALTPSGFEESTKRLSMVECVALPFGEHTILHVQMNGEYLLGIRCGRTAQNLSSNKWWYQNGDTITFDEGEQFYRVSMAKRETHNTYADIELNELDKIDLHITYEPNEMIADIEEGVETFINAANGLSASSHGNMKAYPIIAHISDVHGDYKRFENSIEISNLLHADAIVMSGDIVANNPSNGAKWMHGLLSKSNAKPILCVGNHEVTQSGITDAQVYSYFMEESATIIGNTSGKTYYYTDIPSANLRIISVDLYQYGANTRSNAHMTSEQLEYICNALIDTPSGYGVVIVAHTPCIDVGSLMDSNYPTFFQQLRKYGFTHYDIDGAPIYDIVDAFIGRTTISRTYTQTGSPSSISVSADFSGVDSSVEFIAHMTGHIHEDSVCYLPTTHRQLMLNIECGVCFFGGSSYPYLADDCDTTRLPKGKTQNAINMYIVDRAEKRIKIVRIGASKTYDRMTREYMVIPYAD